MFISLEIIKVLWKMVPYILQLKFKSYIANDSACVSNPDLAGPAAKSEAEIKRNYVF